MICSKCQYHFENKNDEYAVCPHCGNVMTNSDFVKLDSSKQTIKEDNNNSNPQNADNKLKKSKKAFKNKPILMLLIFLIVVFAMSFFQDDAPIDNGFADAEVGDMISFGHYEQDNNLDNGKETIEWIVIDKQDGELLLLSKYALDCQDYSGGIWADSPLRAWLNNIFFNDAFSNDEQEMILTSNVFSAVNPCYNEVIAGSDCSDEVFVLSINECEEYLPSRMQKRCKPTLYCSAKNALTNTDGYCAWILRSPGIRSYYSSYVDCASEIYIQGTDSVSNIAIRPVIRLSIKN